MDNSFCSLEIGLILWGKLNRKTLVVRGTFIISLVSCYMMLLIYLLVAAYSYFTSVKCLNYKKVVSFVLSLDHYILSNSIISIASTRCPSFSFHSDSMSSNEFHKFCLINVFGKPIYFTTLVGEKLYCSYHVMMPSKYWIFLSYEIGGEVTSAMRQRNRNR